MAKHPPHYKKTPSTVKEFKLYMNLGRVKKRYCLGPYCRGKKKFLSLGKYHRLCMKCNQLVVQMIEEKQIIWPKGSITKLD